jgi:hypothetical protein
MFPIKNAVPTRYPPVVTWPLTLYPQPMRTQRAVEYLPSPRLRQPPA